MSFLNNLVHFLEGNHGSGLTPNLPHGTSIGQQPVNVGQALQSGGLTMDSVDPNYAQHVANNQPVDPRYLARRGNQLQVQLQHSPANLGIPTGNQVQMGQLRQMPQLGDFNPGYTPLQNSSFGPGGNPQIGAFQDQPGQLSGPRFNPQDNPYQQYWQ